MHALFLLVALACLGILAAGCSEAPTATPEPTATPTPTPAPTPTPTPTPLPPLTISANTLGRDITARMSEAEISCARGALGDEGYAAMQETSILLMMDAAIEPVALCLSQELSAELVIASISTQVGGISPDSRACLEDFFLEHGGTGRAKGDTAGDILYMFTYVMCLTDEEAMIMMGDEGIPLPSELRCLSAQGGLESFTILAARLEELFTGNPSPELIEAIQELEAAAEICGVELIQQN